MPAEVTGQLGFVLAPLHHARIPPDADVVHISLVRAESAGLLGLVLASLHRARVPSHTRHFLLRILTRPLLLSARHDAPAATAATHVRHTFTAKP